MHHHRRTTAVRAMALALSLLLATGIVLGFTSPSDVQAAPNTAQILEAARSRQNSLNAQIQRLEQEGAELAANQVQANARLAWLNDRSAEQRALFAEKNEQLKEATRTMAAANDAYIEASENLTQKKEQYRTRLQKMFTHRNKSYFQIFIEAGSLKNFFTTIQFMSLVAESDRAMVDELKTAAENAELQQQEAEQARVDMEEVVAQINAQIEKLKADQNATLLELDTIQLKMSRADNNEEALNSESNRLDGEIAQLQKRLNDEEIARAAAAKAAAEKAAAERAAAAAKAAAEKAARERAEAERAAAEKAAAERAARERAEALRTAAAKAAAEKAAAERAAAEREAAEKAAAAKAAAERAAAQKTVRSNSRGWVWPYPPDRTVYSPYGWRIHPVYRTRKFHTGVDLGGYYGAPIVAARDGVVIQVRNTWNGRNTGGTGYGNYVIIAHSGGYSTLYGHLKSVYVREGQAVNAGDRIGTCGSTGTSTGPHLHFEVRVNGSTVNPMNYIG